MSWLGIAFTLITVSSSSVAPTLGRSDEDLPLNAQELRLLEAAEAETSSAGVELSPLGQTQIAVSKDAPEIKFGRQQVDPRQDARGISVSEVLGHSHLPLRFIRNDPGRLRMLNQGQTEHRFTHELDGISLRHLLDTFDDGGAVDLIDPQSVSSLVFDGQSLQIHRHIQNQRPSHQSLWQGSTWLQGGSFLRDFVTGARLTRLGSQSAASIHLASAQPSSGYLASDQETKRHNASVRLNYDGASALPLSWEAGADFDQVRNFVRWDLDARGRAVDQRRERIGGFGGLRWRGEKLRLYSRLHHYQYKGQRSLGSNRSVLDESVQKSGAQLWGDFTLLNGVDIGTNFSLTQENAASELGSPEVKAENQMLVAGLSSDIKWGSQSGSQGKVYVTAGHVIEQLLDGERSEESQYQFAELQFLQSISKWFRWHTEASYRPQLPSVGDLRQGADAKLETFLRLSAGPELGGSTWNIKISGFWNWYKHRIQRDSVRSNITQIDKAEQQGLIMSGHWNWTNNFGLSSYVVLERDAGQNQEDILYSQYRIHYLYAPRKIYLEANLKQLDLEVFTANLFFRVPVGEHLEAQVVIDNMFDMEIKRPGSGLPEPELNVRAALKAHW